MWLDAGQMLLFVFLAYLASIAGFITAIIIIKEPFADYMGRRIGRGLGIGADEYYKEKEEHIKRKSF